MSWQSAANQVPQGDQKQMFPFVQWVNNGTTLEPRERRGGFAMPDEQMELAHGYPAGAVMHGLCLKAGGAPIVVAYTATLTAAVLATRFAWVKEGDFVPTYVKGARGKLQALCVIRSEPGPDGDTAFIAVLTFTGKAGQSFSDALKGHRSRVQKATSKAGQRAPASIFYATFMAGEPEMAGEGTQQSLITPVVLAPEFDLEAAYIGDAALALVDWTAVEEWRKAWDNPKGPNGDGEVHAANGGPPPPPEEPPAEYVPAPAPQPTPPPQPAPPAVRFPAALPFKSAKYPNGTVQTLFNASDQAALQATLTWCAGHPGHDQVKAQAQAALSALQAPPADEIPF